MAAMTYLQICQRLVTEAGIPGGGPSTVLNQTGKLGKVTGWVADAWKNIQLSRPNWNFMWEEFTFNTIADTRDYLAADYAITDLHLWDKQSFLIYLTATGASDQTELLHNDFKVWRGKYRNQMTARSTDRPTLMTILPNKKIRFEPMPDAIYTIEGEYKRTAQLFTADADVPTNLDDDYHMMIVWRALMYYASYENAPEVMDEAEMQYEAILQRLEPEELPTMSQDYMALA